MSASALRDECQVEPLPRACDDRGLERRGVAIRVKADLHRHAFPHDVGVGEDEEAAVDEHLAPKPR